jgi:flagellar motility protein MotE (MotC chaperone)
VYFDLSGAKGILVSLLKLETVTTEEGKTTGTSTDQTKLDQREETLNKKQEELNKKEDELKTKEDELKTKEQDITDRENKVKDAEKTVDDQQKEYFTSVAQIYEKMDVKKAAKAISGLKSTQEMVQVLLYMTKEQAGKVLDQINSTVATQILSEMMK